MKRNFNNWLQAFIEYASFGEAPLHMYFWTGVATVAGALRRKCWIDQAYFQWYPNFYIIIVAPPGIVSKSTTAGIGMDLLRRVPGVKFGPEIVTWQSLAVDFTAAAETFEYQELHHTMSALTIESSEFGNLLDPKDKAMVDALVTWWDGKSMVKGTKFSGKDEIVNPWLNIIACTTPSWIAGNFPEYMISGGLCSRMIFVYADKKRQHVAYPYLHVPKDMQDTRLRLIADLEHIAMKCVGEYKLTAEAVEYGQKWYQEHYTKEHQLDDRFGGYLARKQTHVHKVAMIVAAASGDEMVISKEHLQLAETMVTDLEPEMRFVFDKIGKTDDSLYADRMVAYVKKQKSVTYQELYRFVYSQFPSLRDFEGVFTGCLRAGFLKLVQEPGGVQKVYPGN